MTVADYATQLIDNTLYGVAGSQQQQQQGGLPADASTAATALSIRAWRARPFAPDVIARFRPVAYQIAVVMKHIKNLIDWGDSLFRQPTRESLAQATLLYMLADELLDLALRTRTRFRCAELNSRPILVCDT
ncbi:hypothetical protein OQA88_13180 [Cercophora sp. LCS_1]